MPAGVFEAGVDRPVFTLQISAPTTATYTFTLLDQLDHLGGNLSGAGDDQIKTIDFSSMLVATDADLDQVALTWQPADHRGRRPADQQRDVGDGRG